MTGRYVTYVLVFLACVVTFRFVIEILSELVQRMTGNRKTGGAASHSDARTDLSVALVTGLISMALLASWGVVGMRSAAGISLLAAGIAFKVPGFMRSRREDKRRDLFESSLHDLLTGVCGGLRAGASLAHSLETVVVQLKGPIREEFDILLQKYRVHGDMAIELHAMCKRIDSEDLQLFATAVDITAKVGGSLAVVLEKIAGVVRSRLEFKAKLQAMTAQGRFEAIMLSAAPVVVFGILMIVDPELMKPLIFTEKGIVALSVVAALEITGFLVIKKILAIEV